MELTQANRTGDFVLSLATRTRSLENGILALGENCQAGAVLGQVLAAGAATAVGVPTGNGAITVGAIGPAARPGLYKLVLVAAAADAGTFNFYAPDGSLVRQITVAGGAAANDHIALTIADGSNNFVVGDTFSIEVSAGEFVALDPAGTDGSQIAAGVLYAGANATDAATAIVVVARDAEVKVDALAWPTGITEPERDAAVANLNARGIYLR
jgi:hypothetical protein